MSFNPKEKRDEKGRWSAGGAPGWWHRKTLAEKVGLGYAAVNFGSLAAVLAYLAAKHPGVVASGARKIFDRALGRHEVFMRASQDVARSPGFQKWFSGSKVVGPKGEPLVLYHGTTSKTDFGAFSSDFAGQATGSKTGNLGHFFSRHPSSANIYTRDYSITNPISFGSLLNNPVNQKIYQELEQKLAGPRVIPVHLSVKNPFVMPEGQYNKHMWASTSKTGKDYIMRLRKRLEDEGYDGIKIPRSFRGSQTYSHDAWIAFHPHQIKSVFNHNPTENPDFLKMTRTVHLPSGRQLAAGGKKRRGRIMGRAALYAKSRVVLR